MFRLLKLDSKLVFVEPKESQGNKSHAFDLIRVVFVPGVSNQLDKTIHGVMGRKY